MLVSKVDKKKIMTNLLVLVVLFGAIGFVVLKYLVPKKEGAEKVLGEDNLNITNVKMIKVKEMDTEVINSGKFKSMKLRDFRESQKDVKVGNPDLFFKE